MIHSSTLTATRLRELLSYDPATGVFRRRANGQLAGHRKDNGYIHFSVCGRKYSAHRLAWLYVTGSWPSADVDHIDGDRSNNRFSNLRDVTRSMNLENLRRAKSHNTGTGLLGAYPLPGGRFMSRIRVRGKDRYLGSFDTSEQAHAAYIDAKRVLHEGSTL